LHGESLTPEHPSLETVRSGNLSKRFEEVISILLFFGKHWLQTKSDDDAMMIKPQFKHSSSVGGEVLIDLPD
jgi:hypothetical protein